MARNVVARVKAVKVAPHLPQFFLAVGGQRLDCFVALARLVLGAEALREIGSARQPRCALQHLAAKGRRVARQAGVGEADLL